MLSRQITGEAHFRALHGLAPGGARAADFVVTSKAEWDAVFTNPAAALAGKIVEVSGDAITSVAIASKDMVAEGGVLTIRSANAASKLQRIELSGTTRGIDFSGLSFQMQGWPANYTSNIRFSGTVGALRFLNCSFRHGYGAGLADFDTAADLPEYERIDNVQTATTSTATYSLTWKDAAATSGWVEFFNRGSQTVYVAFGGSGVTASASDTACAPGARVRISSLNPTTATHFAIVSASGTSEVNARAEIGLPYYLARPFNTSGGTVVEDIEITGCTFRDVADGVKSIGEYSDLLVMDNDFDRVYADLVSLNPADGATTRIFRNIECLTFSRAGIAENLSGDAGDPHGGSFQMFNDGTATAGPVYRAGNRQRVTPMRADAHSGGAFFSDNDIDPSYTNIFLINEMQVGGTGTATNLGETNYPIRDAYIYGETIFAFDDPTATDPQFRILTDGDGTVYAGSVVAMNVIAVDEPFEQDGVVDLLDVASIAAVFPNYDDLASATTRAEIEGAMTTAAEGLGLGMAATVDAIDWSTTDPDEVIQWENLPSGAHWNALTFQDVSTLISLPLRRIMNQRASQTVSVGTGTEWRSYESDGTTLDTDWTSSSGTIEPDQYIQIRRTTSASELTAVIASVTINGFEQTVSLTTGISPSAYLVTPGTTGWFKAPANVPGSTTHITFRGKFDFPSITAGMLLFAQESTGCDLKVQADGSCTATVEDGTGAKTMTNVTVLPAGSITTGDWLDIVFDVNHATEEVTMTLNGVESVTPFTTSGNGVFQSSRPVSMLAGSTGSSPITASTKVADLSLDFNGLLYKTIANDAATANADSWKRGGDLTD